MKEKAPKVPVLRGEVKKSGTTTLLAVFCPFCDRVHTHGWPDADSTKPQYRSAHCAPGQKETESGYKIAPFRVKDRKAFK